MKNKFIAAGLIISFTFFYGVKVILADSALDASYRANVNFINSNSAKINGWNKDAKKYCSIENFNIDKCKNACKNLDKYSKEVKECKNLVNPSQAILAPAVKKNTIIDLLQKKKNEWKLRRVEFLSNLKAEKDRLRLEFKEKFTEERCARVQERIKNKLAHFADAKGKHTSVYVNLVNRINKFIARADEQKLDTTAIKSHLVILQEKIDKFKEDYAAYAAKLEETKNYTCGHSEGEFKGVLLESKTLLKTVHADAADIRTYVRETILVDLKALKAQMPDTEDDDEVTKTETNN